MRVNPNAADSARYFVSQRQNGGPSAYRIMNRADAVAQRKLSIAQPSPGAAQTPPTAQITAPPESAASAPALPSILQSPLLTKIPSTPTPGDSTLGTYGDLHLKAVKNAFGAVQGDDRYNAVADANSDGVVDFDDTTHILSNWGKPVTGSSQAPAVFNEDYLALVQANMGAKAGEDRFTSASDANGDGVVDFDDITHVLANWGKPVPSREDPPA